eukprot:TRINITY_DN764_c0_g2_i2.p1 TRINITY_DN764_c0_g2~~TRINITY_DN764_c0_g2_i2.p1  ORF type:complete len:275 (+),score=36.22 TRINITY_DN764_c0_g2_i2:99-827(+)
MRHITANTTPYNPSKEPRIKSEPFKAFPELPDTDTLLTELKSEQQRVKRLELELQQIQSEAALNFTNREKTMAEIRREENALAEQLKGGICKKHEDLEKENEELMQKLKFINNVTENDLLAAKAEIDYWVSQCQAFESQSRAAELKKEINLARRKRRKYKSKYKKAKQGLENTMKSDVGLDNNWRVGFRTIGDELSTLRKEVEGMAIRGNYKKPVIKQISYTSYVYTLYRIYQTSKINNKVI